MSIQWCNCVEPPTMRTGDFARPWTSDGSWENMSLQGPDRFSYKRMGHFFAPMHKGGRVVDILKPHNLSPIGNLFQVKVDTTKTNLFHNFSTSFLDPFAASDCQFRGMFSQAQATIQFHNCIASVFLDEINLLDT